MSFQKGIKDGNLKPGQNQSFANFKMVKIPIVLLVAFTVSRVNGQDLATLLVGLTSGGGNGACPKGFSTPTTATSRSAESPYLYDLIMRSFAARQAAVSTPCFK